MSHYYQLFLYVLRHPACYFSAVGRYGTLHVLSAFSCILVQEIRITCCQPDCCPITMRALHAIMDCFIPAHYC